MRAELVSDQGTGPALAYVPGIDGTGELLLGTAVRLEAHFRLLRFRYVDEGEPGSLATYERLADTVAASLASVGVERAVFVAESFGGGVALHLALRHPERVQALALVNTFAWFPRRIRLWFGAALFPYVPQAVLRFGRRYFAERIFFRPRKDPEAEAAFRAIPPGFAQPGFAARMKAMRFLDVRERLHEIDVRCELYSATHDGVVPTRITMPVLAKGLPNAALIPIEKANHLVLPLAEEPWVRRLVELEESTRE